MRCLALLSVALAAALPFAARAAEPIDLGPGVSDYQRFMVYPHLQRAFEAQARGDFDAAIDGFQRARSYAPRSANVALFLADAYRRAGRPALAERVLAEQRRYTPGDARLAAAPTPMRAAAASARALPPTLPASPAVPVIAPRPAVTSPRNARAAVVGPKATRPPTAESDRRLASEITAALETGDAARADRLLAGVPSTSFPEARLATDLALGRREAAARRAVALVRATPSDAALFDRVTYRLVAAGEGTLAARLLLDAWPSPVASTPALVTRLAALISSDPSRVTPDDRIRLAAAPAVAGAKVELSAALGDCGTATRVAAEADAVTAAGWSALASCTTSDRAAMLDALRTAVAKGADATALRAFAYRAFEAREYAAALDAWHAVPSAQLEPDHLLAAATTAVAANRAADAGIWLDEYERRGVPQTDAYWWLRAVSLGGSAGERAAIDHAISFREDARYLARRAQLQSAAGERDAAVASLERAHALAPDDEAIAASLGYALIAVGRDGDALPLLAAYRTRHAEQAPVAEDLAELHRRLLQPDAARTMAATAIDLLGPDGDPDRVFRLRRLYEQLGRTWTVSADATLGNAVAGTNTTIPGGAYRSYAQVEAAYRFGQVLQRPDRDALSAYARIFAGAQGGGVWPDDLPTLGVGLRWKPFETRVLYVALERQIALDMRDARDDDTLLRVSAAPLTDPRIGDDWHASGAGWWSHTIYLDAAHYLRRGDSAATADYQVGHHFKLGDGETLQPFARAQWNGRWQDGGFDRDARLGLGLRWNRWYGGDAHEAWPHRLVIGLELQNALTTYLPERRTLFVNVGSYW
ncbi:NfrA family protein [Lysobacter xanthus]